MQNPPIRVLLADDHTMFRQGLKEMLSIDEGMEVVGEADNGEQAVALSRETRPDVVLLDVEMPVMGAEEAMEQIFEISPIPRIVIVTMYDDSRLVRKLLARGASAYLVKSASLEELLSVVRAAAEDPLGPEENAIMVVPQEVLEKKEREADELSVRELEILLLVARGMSNRQIAASLHLSEATIKRHLANIYPKMHVTSRSEATRKALSEGWISTREITQEGESKQRQI